VHSVTLGRSGPAVSAVGLGCMGMSEFYGPSDKDESISTLRRAVDLGVTFLDTSDAYGIGANESLLGEFVAGLPREDVVLSTKFGVVRDPETGRPVGMRGDAEYVRQACEASLRRLGTDHIDLYYLHVPDPKTPVEQTVAAMAELVAAGKVRHLGLSNLGPDQVRAAAAVAPIAAVQLEWSLFSRDVEAGTVQVCAELGIGFVPYAPLGRGMLTGVYTGTDGLAPTDYRQAVPRFNAENGPRNVPLVEAVRAVAAAHGATPGQVALAWLLHRSTVYGTAVVPIPGTRRVGRIEENAGAADLELTAADLAALEPLAGRVAGAGTPPLPSEIARMRAEQAAKEAAASR
jgi:aryl-alcohol dehydrogenase-like predicted oxidoreductase